MTQEHSQTQSRVTVLAKQPDRVSLLEVSFGPNCPMIKVKLVKQIETEAFP